MSVTISAACINEHKALLLIRERGIWNLPGGIPQDGEHDTGCLSRVFMEKIPSADYALEKIYGDFSGSTQLNSTSTVRVFLANVKGDIRPGMGVGESRFFTLRELYDLEFSAIMLQIIEKLISEGHLK